MIEAKEAHDFFWKALGAKSKLLGLDAPKRTHMITEDVNLITENHPAAERLAQLAAWARETHAINVNGFNPALPPGMTERAKPTSNGPGPVNEYDPGRLNGKSMWSMALENPSED